MNARSSWRINALLVVFALAAPVATVVPLCFFELGPYRRRGEGDRFPRRPLEADEVSDWRGPLAALGFDLDGLQLGSAADTLGVSWIDVGGSFDNSGQTPEGSFIGLSVVSAGWPLRCFIGAVQQTAPNEDGDFSRPIGMRHVLELPQAEAPWANPLFDGNIRGTGRRILPTRLMPGAFLLNAAFWFIALYVTMRLSSYLHKLARRLIAPEACSECGYSRGKDSGGRCPECGSGAV